jgi:diacylglycerol kinase family enzyme
MSSPVYIILNALAGPQTQASEDMQQRLLALFKDTAIHPSIALARCGTEVRDLAHRAVQEGAQTLVAGGGDGTINAVASALVGTEVALGVLPLGTLNHFAKDLHIPLDIEGAVHTLLEGHSMPIDVGEVNGHVFLNNSSLGLYPRLVRHRQKQQERLGRGKWPAFLSATLLILRRYPLLQVRLRLDQEEIIRRTPFLFIGNNEYQLDTLKIGARVCLNAGCLSLYMAQHTGRLGLFLLALRGLVGRLRSASDFDTLCVQEVTIETRHPRLLVATDGEVRVIETPLHYRVRPRALRVLIPRAT